MTAVPFSRPILPRADSWARWWRGRRSLLVAALHTPAGVVAVVWGLLAAVAIEERAAWAIAFPGQAGPGRWQDLFLLCLWAAAAPWIVHYGRRRPVAGATALEDIVRHLLTATAFIVISNVAIRLPMMLAPHAWGATDVARSTLAALARFYPAALLAYAAIIALSRRTLGNGRLSSTVGSTPAGPPVQPARVVVREWNRVHLVEPGDIQWAEADDNYVVVQVGRRTCKARGRLRDLETQLDPSRFVRIHRSAIVQVDRIAEVQPLGKGDLALVLRDGKKLRVARSRRPALERALHLAE